MFGIRTRIAVCLIGIALAGLTRPAWTQGEAPPAKTGNETEALTRAGDAGRVREVRLALVCYGGSSLAIYIHGNAKELHRLVIASKALQIDVNASGSPLPSYMADRANLKRPEPGPQGLKLKGSTRVWYDRLLDVWLQDPQRVRTRVVVDVIAGTSAGGINGVILAKALAHDLSQDELTTLWMEKASLRRLTDNYFGFLKIFAGKAPINGNALAGWLFEALDGMDRQAVGGRRSLLPRGDRLDLFVTTTDLYGYPQQVVINDPALAAEKHFPHVLHFIYSGENRGCKEPSGAGAEGLLDDFCPEWTQSLAFSARASSSIPGVFPPLKLGATLGRFARMRPTDKQIVGVEPPAPFETVVSRLFRNYQLQEPNRRVDYARDTYFVDGGVLDNHPFGPAIAEVLRRPHDQEVKRFLLYLQPDPGKPPGAPNGKPPGLLGTIKKGISGLPSQQPILGDLNDVAAYNENVRRIHDIVHSEEVATQALERKGGASPDCQKPESLTVAQRFGCAAGYSAANLDDELKKASLERLRATRLAVEEAADQGVTELAGRSYYSLRVHSVLDQFVEVIAGESVCNYPPESAHRALVARIIERWAQKSGLIDDPEAPEDLPDPIAQKKTQLDFLKDFDIGYQRRQLRFVTDWINGQYTAKVPPTQSEREALDELKAAAAERIEDLTRLVAGNAPDPQLIEQVKGLQRLFGNLSPWPGPDGKAQTIQELARRFVDDGENLAALAGLRKNLGEALERLQQQVRLRSFDDFKKKGLGLPDDKRQQILVRYFGFPFWDRQIYPLVAFSDLGEFAQIEVVRLSPDDATLLGGGSAKMKLVGAHTAHFGAFLKRSGRESDYVWGRLDAAERLLTMLGIPGQGAGDLFRSIVDEVRVNEADLIRGSILKARDADIDNHFPK